MKYRLGTKIRYKGVDVRGVIVKDDSPYDIHVRWDNGVLSSYDEWFLSRVCEILVSSKSCLVME